MSHYYENKLDILEKLFGKKIKIKNSSSLIIDDVEYSTVNDIIVLNELKSNQKYNTVNSFGEEWNTFSQITSEHFVEFDLYFNQVDLNKLNNKVICDFGCGIGRWSKILSTKVDFEYLILVDLSDSINVARQYFYENDNVIFIKCDLDKLIFKQNCIDFFYCLGVLHHLPDKYPKAISKIHHCSRRGLIYLYYDLKNRGKFFKFIFKIANIIRLVLIRMEKYEHRVKISYLLTFILYMPFVLINKLLILFKIKKRVPLEFYSNSSIYRIRQDAYDRFFTDIEHRYGQSQILKNYSVFFKKIKFSKYLPYWTFYVEK